MIPQAHGYGELRDMPRRIGSIQRWPEVLSALTAPALQTAAADYLAALDKRDRSDALHRVDKAPLNFHHAGLMALMFPRATIIWCRRDPRDLRVDLCRECRS